jgi:hypothetical protein
MPDQCDTCTYYRMRSHGEKQVGECRCRSPGPGFMAQWPQVKPDDWCGEFAALPTARRSASDY